MNPPSLPRALFAAALLAGFGHAAAGVHQPQRPATTGRSRVVIVSPSGLKYEDLKIGDGAEASAGKIVAVRYAGWLGNHSKLEFDSSRDRPFTFRLGAGDVLKGWDEGLLGMRVGGKRRLIIPPDLGFGKQGVGSVVPPNSVLIYEFELLEVREAASPSR
jgi:FKBP-type peptidyl-prolyl cis-trans isomerase FkpA